MKLIPIFGNLSIIKIRRVRVPLTDLPWHLVSSTPTTFITQHTHKKKMNHFQTRIHPRNSNFWNTTTHPRNSNFSSIQMFLTTLTINTEQKIKHQLQLKKTYLFEAKCHVIEVSHWSHEIALELLHIMHIPVLYCQYESEWMQRTYISWVTKITFNNVKQQQLFEQSHMITYATNNLVTNSTCKIKRHVVALIWKYCKSWATVS